MRANQIVHPIINFNPRSHCRERQELKKDGIERFKISINVPIAGNDAVEFTTEAMKLAFQSTFPLQGTNKRIKPGAGQFHISIHVPIAGNDSKLIQFLIYNCKIFVLYYSYL